MQIVYQLEKENGNFSIISVDNGQQISVWKNRLRRILDIHPQTVAGCCDIDSKTAEYLGFVIPSPLKREWLTVAQRDQVARREARRKP
jgi:hypothetical protein